MNGSSSTFFCKICKTEMVAIAVVKWGVFIPDFKPDHIGKFCKHKMFFAFKTIFNELFLMCTNYFLLIYYVWGPYDWLVCVCRFRIAAVYSNNDNQMSPTSKKLHLNSEVKPSQVPPTPRLTTLIPAGPDSIQISWDVSTATTLSTIRSALRLPMVNWKNSLTRAKRG